MATYGLTSAGYVPKPLSAILADAQAYQLANISPSLNLFPPDPLAVITALVADTLASLDQLILAMYTGMDPDTASADQLTGLSLISGTNRLPATYTQVACSITTDAAFPSQAAGTMFASVTGVPGVLFTNAAAFSAAGAGTTTGVLFNCVNPGPVVVNAGSLTVISIAIAHWTAITNPANGVVGTNVQTDATLRQARQAELQAAGTANAAAIAGNLRRQLQPANSPLTVPDVPGPFIFAAGVISCTVLFNDTEVVDANGLPAHSIEAIVWATDNGSPTVALDTVICALILSLKAAGISTYSGGGTLISETVTDAQGTAETILATRPGSLPTNITLTIKAMPTGSVSEDSIKAAIFAFASGTDVNGVPLVNNVGAWQPGVGAYQSGVMAAAFRVPGVIDVPEAACILSAANVGLNVIPTARQVVTIGAIVVNLT